MAIEINSTIFCTCGGVWIVKNEDDTKVFVCPVCGTHKPIPEKTSNFRIKL